ncbi:MAG: PAS domain S-box protein [Desulfobacterales bacterium]|nr:PAS domain S-box protein [Desulfobacterales bacterium]
MESKLIQFQVFYEIAMTIGNSLDLHQMLRSALVVYLRKLSCASGVIMKLAQPDPCTAGFAPELSIPRTAAAQPVLRKVIHALPDNLSPDGLEDFRKTLPLYTLSDEGPGVYTMDLPGFGLLLLAKGGPQFDMTTLQSLDQLNRKLAGACVACQQKTRIEMINDKLSREIGVRRRTENKLMQLAGELEQRVAERTESLNALNEELMKKIAEIEAKEVSLKESEERYRSLLQATPDPVVVYDKDGRVLFVNPAFTRVFGWRFGEIRGKLLNFVPEDRLEETHRLRQKVLSEGGCVGIESRRLTKKGDVLDVSISGATYQGPSGDVLGVIVNLRDITEMKQAQDMMIQAEKMVSLGGLAAGMAHEINNPLSGILQSAQVIENRLKGDLPANRKVADACGVALEDMADYMDRRGIFKLSSHIRRSGRQAAQIVDDMLSFSRKESTSYQPSDVNQIIDDALMMADHDYDLKKSYDFSRIKIFKSYDMALPQIPCIPNQIQQVVFNLLKNAAQAMVEDADAEKIPMIQLATYAGEGGVCIEMSDNGPGMDDQVRQRLFEPFFTTKGVGKGTGLGLSVSYFIITERHGGKMQVSSTRGRGSRFSIELPVSR